MLRFISHNLRIFSCSSEMNRKARLEINNKNETKTTNFLNFLNKTETESKTKKSDRNDLSDCVTE